ncbi:hypothetical protein [Hyphomicrobium sp. MC1]|uniref:hypothetical protein n=1 Tax=Hyphomicrobium sp. (strain MC1) TaxID=717785 RepID=UPI000213DA9A|nr:hypothetical protein [Hyphomicrobium sp. MC1]CCB64447.1 protein of unknown function [Hyphomicrobium sp. MC1]
MTPEQTAIHALNDAMQQVLAKLTAHDILIRDLTALVYERTGMSRAEISKRHELIRKNADEAPVEPQFADPVAGWIHLVLDEVENTIRKDPLA